MLVRKHPRVNATPGPLLVAAGWIALAATSSCGQAGVVASTPARAGQAIWPDAEPVVLALLLDASASPWKRQNAAAALGAYGTAAVAGPLRQIASDPPATEDLRTLQSTARDALDRLEHRLHANQGLVVPTQP
jgi:hypothetical protein